MEALHLKRPYPRVRCGGRLSYGGSQMWFESRTVRCGGCGLIACADVLLYLTGRGELPIEEYRAYIGSLRRYFPLIPRRGIDGVRMAWGMNRCLRERGLPLRARWCASGGRFWDRLAELLRADLPVVISIGPNLPRFWEAGLLPLYRRAADGSYAEDSRTRAHFVTVTGLDAAWMEVSSWGRRLYIERRSYEEYARRHSMWLFNNLLYIEKKVSGS